VTYFRWSVGGVLLWLGALNAVASWTMTTCTQGAADSLYGWIITLPFFVLGWAIIPKQGVNPATILGVAAFPAIMAAFVTIWTGLLVAGGSACALITGLPFEKDGRETAFAIAWSATSVVFWIGMAFALYRASSGRKAVVEQD